MGSQGTTEHIDKRLTTADDNKREVRRGRRKRGGCSSEGDQVRFVSKLENEDGKSYVEERPEEREKRPLSN